MGRDILGNNESAGKRKSGRTRKDNKHILSAFVQSARVITRQDSYLSTQYHLIAARRGKIVLRLLLGTIDWLSSITS